MNKQRTKFKFKRKLNQINSRPKLIIFLTEQLDKPDVSPFLVPYKTNFNKLMEIINKDVELKLSEIKLLIVTGKLIRKRVVRPGLTIDDRRITGFKKIQAKKILKTELLELKGKYKCSKCKKLFNSIYIKNNKEICYVCNST